MREKGFASVFLLLILIIGGIVAVGMYAVTHNQKSSVSQISNITQNNNLSEENTDNVQEERLPQPLLYTFERDGDIWVGGDDIKTRKLTNYKYNYYPILTHDKKRIIYLSEPLEFVKQDEEIQKNGGILDGLGPGNNIWVIDIDGKNAKKLTESPIASPFLHLSPDDAYISFISPYDNKLIILQTSDGKEISNISLDGSAPLDDVLVWDRDSKHLIVATTLPNETQYAGANLYRVTVGSSEKQKVGTIPQQSGKFFLFKYSISPDSKRVAYFTEGSRLIKPGEAKYDWSFWISDVDNNNAKEILNKKNNPSYHGPNINFNWSSDSNFVSFFNEETYLLNIPTKLYVYDLKNEKLYDAFESASTQTAWDWEDNLYIKRFSNKVGVEKGISKLDFRKGTFEQFLDNAENLNFGN